MNELTSAHNPKYKRWLSLLDSKGIKKEGRAILSGPKLTGEFLRSWPAEVEDILIPPKFNEEFPSSFRQTLLSSPLFKELDVLGTRHPLLVVKTPKLPEWKNESPRGLELIVALGDPANLGALLRSADAFGASRVILARESASPYLPKALKASANAVFRVQMAQGPSLKELKLTGAYGLDMDGEDLAKFTWPVNFQLVLGEEGLGLPEIGLKKLKIRMNGQAESLNATVAASIALFSYRNGTSGRQG